MAPMQVWLAAGVLAAAAAVGTASAQAGTPGPAPATMPGHPTAPELATPATSRVDTIYFSGRPADALALCDSLLASDSTNFDLLWRASRAALALGILAPRQTSNDPMLIRAEAFGRTAARLRPERVEGHYWLAAAMGRRALHADLRTTARLARAVYESATHALAIDSLHAGANDVMGKLNSEVRKLPSVYRFIAGNLLGVSVAKHTSWALAEQYLQRAVSLDPTMILYRVDLGQLYVRTGRMSDAQRVLRDVASMPRIHPEDSEFQREARSLLGVATAPIHR